MYDKIVDEKIIKKHKLFLPKRFIMEFRKGLDEYGIECCRMYLDKEQYGDTITDQSYSTRNYIYHDCFHLAFWVYLKWSPVMRTLYGVQRTPKHHKIIGNVEDRGRTRIIEESIIFMVASIKDELLQKGLSKDHFIWNYIQYHLGELSVGDKTLGDWNAAIKSGILLMDKLVLNEGGFVVVDQDEEILYYGK